MTEVQADGEAASSKDRILKAAREVFAAEGLAGARVDEIARRARCNKALVYYYFDSKDDLYDAVYSAEAGRRMPILDAVRSASFHEWLGGLVDATTHPDDSSWIRLIAREGLNGTAITARQQRAELWAQCVGLLRRAQAQGEIDQELDPEMVVLMFVLTTLGSQTLRQFTELIAGESPDAQGFSERLRKFHLSIADHLRPPAERGDAAEAAGKALTRLV